MNEYRYIIKNCEQIHSSDNFCWSKNVLCQDCTDCILKQIVEKCKFWVNAEKNNKYKTNGWILSDDILHLLDILEVE